MKRWLIDNNYTVLPNHRLPLINDAYTNEVTTIMSECELSIHMFGPTYGLVPEGTLESKSVIQNRIGSKLSTQKQLKRIIWSPPGVVSSDQRQVDFLEALKVNPELQKGADYLITPLEDLKFAIQDKMVKEKEKPTEKQNAVVAPVGHVSPAQVYLICDEADLDAIVPIEDYLFNQGFEVFIPAFEGKQSELRADHQENMKSCDAVIIYFGAGSDLWVRTKLRDLMKISGYGRTQPLNVKATVLAKPETRTKTRFRAQGIEVVQMLSGFNESLLEGVSTKIKSLKG